MNNDSEAVSVKEKERNTKKEMKWKVIRN